MVKETLRSLAPVGLVDFWRAKRFFENVDGDRVSSWRAALSPRRSAMLASSRLRFVPPEILRDARCIVDVGAHVGGWSEAVLELVAPKQLIAIEPTPDSFDRLAARVGGRPNVRLIRCAAGAARGRAEFRIMSASDLNSLLPVRDDLRRHYPHVEGRDTITVEVMPLDELLGDVRDIALLKIDVQGAESTVLDGARAVLERTRAVLLEVDFVSHYEGDTPFGALNKRMTEELGFELYSLAPAFYNARGRLIWADAVYTRGVAG